MVPDRTSWRVATALAHDKRFLRELLLVIAAHDPVQHDIFFVNFEPQVFPRQVGCSSQSRPDKLVQAKRLAWIPLRKHLSFPFLNGWY